MLIGLYYVVVNSLSQFGNFARIVLVLLLTIIGIVYIAIAPAGISLRKTNSVILNLFKMFLKKLICGIINIFKFLIKLPKCIFSKVKKQLNKTRLSKSLNTVLSILITALVIIIII